MASNDFAIGFPVIDALYEKDMSIYITGNVSGLYYGIFSLDFLHVKNVRPGAPSSVLAPSSDARSP